VSGLSVGSAVELRGVRVGKVTSIGFSWNDYQDASPGYVVVVFEIWNAPGLEISTDATAVWLGPPGFPSSVSAIVAEFAQRVGKGRCSHAPEDGQLRSTGSFLTLLHTALRDDADYFAFSDQDDVWLPDKLAHAVAALGEVAADRPALYFCDRTLVDESLRFIGQPSRLRRPPGSCCLCRRLP